jgi:hypothetical protein
MSIKGKNILTDELLKALPTNQTIKRGVSNKTKGDDPAYQEKIRKTVTEQWASKDQSNRITSVRKGVTKLWEDPEYRQKQKRSRELNGQYTNPEKAANFKSPIIGTCKKTSKKRTFLGAQQLRDAGFEPGNVYACLSGNRKSTGGYTWTRP